VAELWPAVRRGLDLVTRMQLPGGTMGFQAAGVLGGLLFVAMLVPQQVALVPGVAVLPHFDTFGHRWVDSAIEAAPRPDVVLVGVDERSAAMWQDGAWRSYGPGGVTVIAGGQQRRFDSGEIADLPAPA